MDEKKSTINLNIVLFKETVKNYTDAYEKGPDINIVNIRAGIKYEGIIVYSKSKHTQPKWKTLVDEISERKIDLSANTSNKAAIIVKIRNRFMAVVLGYGKSLLRADKFERNFGLKAALNMIEEKQMRSIQSAVIEDMIVSTQQQASRRTSQEEFDLNAYSDILRSVTGKPYDEDLGNTISGKDTLSVSVPMDINELGEKLDRYLEAYQDDRYQRIGFKWVDNINEIRDPELKEKLNGCLGECLIKKDIHNMYIAPPDIIDPELIEGYCFSGIGKELKDVNNYSFEPNLMEYADKLDSNDTKRIIEKIRRDRLETIDSNGAQNAICNVFSSIVWECILSNKTYIIWNGSWYYIENDFFKEVNDFISRLPLCPITLPSCDSNESEGAYNERVAQNNAKICLMDKKLISVKGSAKQIEACDLFVNNKMMIHVKKRANSSQLSHLFSQGRVSAECFLSDELFREQVYIKVKDKLGDNVFSYKEKPNPNEYEVVYAIIAEKSDCSVKKLPFFSKVNLMLTCQSLERTRFGYSICFIEQK